MSEHHSCCGCGHEHGAGMGRRTCLAAVGGSTLGGAVLSGCATAGAGKKAAERPRPTVAKKEIVVQPVLSYRIYQRAEKTSWRPWGAVHTEADVEQEVVRIAQELADLGKKAEFPVKILPVAKVTSPEQGAQVCKGDCDVMLIYGANGEAADMESLISPNRYNLVFVRHRNGPVSLWYEIVSPILMRKMLDELGQPGLKPCDVIVDSSAEILWRLRALYALKNTLGTRIVAIGSASGWGPGGAEAPKIAANLWKMDIVALPYAELAKRIESARAEAGLMARAEAEADAYLKQSGVTLQADKGAFARAFLLKDVFRKAMDDNGATAMTICECMSTIMPMSQTTACMPLSLINDAGLLAFCESDFVVIPSGVLLNHIAATPVFLNDPTYPHDGLITLAHCTAPSKMDGKHPEKVTVLTHYESDYGAA
ncbi:MAG: sugar isomerase, partial [Candidatus Hydrogenedentes bacterium]|nr:sugar isomerase [Candidatus Hydrogenedentota bacterium]